MTPFGFPEEPARDRRYDQLPFPVDSPSAGIDYSDAAGLIVAPDRTTPPEVVRVTSATATSGLYPARRELWSDAAAPPRLSDRSTAQDCWAQGPNGEALTATRYDALFLGYHSDGLPVYSAADLGAGGGGGVRMRNIPAFTIDVNPCTELRFTMGTGSGLSLADLSGSVYPGAASLSLLDASATQAGQITAGNQTLGGNKTIGGVTTGALWLTDKVQTSPGANVPTYTLGSGAGTGASLTLLNAGNVRGRVAVTTGTTPAAGPTQNVFILFFNPANFALPPTVVVTPANRAAAELSGNSKPYVNTVLTDRFILTAPVVPLAASTAYEWFYIAIG